MSWEQNEDETRAEPGRTWSVNHPTFVLTRVAGPNGPLQLGEGELDAVSVDGARPSRLLVGTSPVCGLRVVDPHVSRRHVAVEVEGGWLRLTDLDSTNGTYVNGLRVKEAFLLGGESISLGHTLHLALTRQAAKGPPVLSQRDRFGSLLGRSEAMRKLYPLAERLARSDVPLVVEGETGTGKEQLSESIHQESPRAAKPFVVFDCTAVAPTLIESVLFGHERGAFTGAVQSVTGVFEQAQGGTLLIDEIGDLPLELQAKLLRVIERGQLVRLGSTRPIDIDVRLLFATRRDLDQEVQTGRFRDDLFHRIAVTRIELPRLRERRGDVTFLAQHFCRLQGEPLDLLTPELLASWEAWSWPGNVRELRNAVSRRIALGDLASPDQDEAPSSSAFVDAARPGAGSSMEDILASGVSLQEGRQRVSDEYERLHVEMLVRRAGGNVTQAALVAGMSRRQLQRILAKRKSG